MSGERRGYVPPKKELGDVSTGEQLTGSSDSTARGMEQPMQVEVDKRGTETLYTYSAADSTAATVTPEAASPEEKKGAASSAEDRELKLQELYKQKELRDKLMEGVDMGKKGPSKEYRALVKEIIKLEKEQAAEDAVVQEAPAHPRNDVTDRVHGAMDDLDQAVDANNMAARVDAAMAEEDRRAAEAAEPVVGGDMTAQERTEAQIAAGAVATAATIEAGGETAEQTPEEAADSNKFTGDTTRDAAEAAKPPVEQGVDETIDDAQRAALLRTTDSTSGRRVDQDPTAMRQQRPGLMTRLRGSRIGKWLIGLGLLGAAGIAGGSALAGREKGPEPSSIVNSTIDHKSNKSPVPLRSTAKEDNTLDQQLAAQQEAVGDAAYAVGQKAAKQDRKLGAEIARTKRLARGAEKSYDASEKIDEFAEGALARMKYLEERVQELKGERSKTRKTARASESGLDAELTMEEVKIEMAKIDKEMGQMNEIKGANYNLSLVHDETQPDRPIVGYDLRIGGEMMSLTPDRKAELFEKALNLEADSAKKLASDSALSEKAIKYMTLFLAKDSFESMAQAGPNGERLEEIMIDENLDPLTNELVGKRILEPITDMKRHQEIEHALKEMGLGSAAK